MANSAILSDGTTEYEFVYDAATQDDYKLRYGMSVGGSEPAPLWHNPDSAPPQLVRLTNQNQVIFLTTIVFGTDRNDVLNNLVPIKRWVDGGDQQAARYHTEGDVDKIYCRIQLDGATNYTDWTVVYGSVDDSKAFYNPVSDKNTLALDVTVMLICEPLGDGASFTMNNDLDGDPGMTRFISGTAYGLTAVGTPTLTANTTNYLSGASSQRIVTDSSTTEGVQTNTVTCSTSTNIRAFVWVQANAGADDLTIALLDGSGNTIDSETFDPGNPANYDKTAVGSAGSTWYRYALSGQNTAAADARLRIQRASGDATTNSTYNIDNLYLRQSTTVTPDAWMSSATVVNRHDHDGTNINRINVIDGWGIPGDSDALMTWRFNMVSIANNTGKRGIFALRTDGTIKNANFKHWYGSDEIDASSAGTGSWALSTAAAGRTEGEYARFTSGATDDTGTIQFQFADITDLRQFMSSPRRIFALARSSNIASTIEINAIEPTADFDTAPASFSTANEWELLDLGVHAPIKLSDEATGVTTGEYHEYKVTAPATSVTIDIDAIVHLPKEDGHFIVTNTEAVTVTNNHNLTLDGPNEIVLTAGRGKQHAFRGEFWTAPAGIGWRLYWILVDNDVVTPAYNEHTLADSAELTCVVVPRTRHLLGTL